MFFASFTYMADVRSQFVVYGICHSRLQYIPRRILHIITVHDYMTISESIVSVRRVLLF